MAHRLDLNVRSIHATCPASRAGRIFECLLFIVRRKWRVETEHSRHFKFYRRNSRIMVRVIRVTLILLRPAVSTRIAVTARL